MTLRRFTPGSLADSADGSVAGLIASQRRAGPEAITRSRSFLPSDSERTDAEGRFRVPIPPGALPLAFEVSHPEHVTVVSDPFLEAPETPIQINLPLAGILEVRFEPEPGLELISFPYVFLTPSGFYGSFQAGELRFRYPLLSPFLEPDKQAQRADPKPFDPKRPFRTQVVGRLRLEAFGSTSGAVEVEVLPGATEVVKLRLARARGIRGLVVDTGGKPVSGLWVVAKRGHEEGSSFTNREGRFEITGVTGVEEGPVSVHVVEPGTGKHREGVEAQLGGDPVELVFDEAERGRLELILAGLDASPWDQSLRLEPTRGGTPFRLKPEKLSQIRLLASRGHYDPERPLSYVRIPAGDYLLKGRVDRFVPNKPLPVTIRSGETTRLRVQFRVGATLVVTVLSKEGRPLEDALVRVVGQERDEETTGSDGLLTLAGLTEGTHRILAVGPGHAPTRVSHQVPPEGGTLSIRLGEGILLEGVLRDASGAPLPDRDLLLRGESGDYLRTRSDGAGRYRRPNLAEGVYELFLINGKRGPWKIQVKGTGTQRLDLNAPN